MNLKKIGLWAALALTTAIVLMAASWLQPSPSGSQSTVSSPSRESGPANVSSASPKKTPARSPQPCSTPKNAPKLSKEAWKMVDELQDPCAGG